MKIYKLGRVSKAALEVLDGMNYDDIDHNKFLLIRKEDVDKDPESYRDTMRIISPVKIVSQGVDVNLIRKNYEIPKNYHLDYWKINSKNITCIFSDPASAHKTTLIINNVERCCSNKVLDYYIYKANFICDLSNVSGADDIIKAAHEGVVKDEGLYYMSSDILKKLNRILVNKIPTNTYNAYYYKERSSS